MDAWEKVIFQMIAQGVIRVGINYMTSQDSIEIFLWERRETEKSEQDRMMMKMTIILAQNGELSHSKTRSIIMARRSSDV